MKLTLRKYIAGIQPEHASFELPNGKTVAIADVNKALDNCIDYIAHIHSVGTDDKETISRNIVDILTGKMKT